MKRFFREAKALWSLILMVAAIGCTEDFDPTAVGNEPEVTGSEKILLIPEGAAAGRLAVRVSPEMAEQIEAAQTRSGTTRSGIAAIDEGLESIEASSFSRLFVDPLFEADLREAGLHLWYKVSFSEESDLRRAAQALARAEEISVVEYMHHPLRPRTNRPNTPIEPMAEEQEEEEYIYPMDDADLRKQWHYDNRGLMIGSHEGADINLFPAWKICTGNKDIVVAVIDDPVQASHPDLEKNMWVNNIDGDTKKYAHGANFCTDEEEPAKLDWNYVDSWDETPSHGTHVAGTIAAVNGNGIGVCGIAGGHGNYGGVKIMSCQIFYEKKGSEAYYPEAASKALIWSANRGALIAQCSFGYDPGLSQTNWEKEFAYEKEAIEYFINRERTNAPIDGGLAIFAAGNDGSSTYGGVLVKDRKLVPGCFEPVIAVAATSPDFRPAGYTCYGNWVDISAPGGDIENFGYSGSVYSTIIGSVNDNVQYGYMEGTSMACPHVTGVAALGLSHAADLGLRFTTEEFRGMLLSSTREIDSYCQGMKSAIGFNYDYQYGEEVMVNLSNYRNKMGGGLVDAFKMLMQVEGSPVITVTTGQEQTLPLEILFGGGALTSNFRVEVLNEQDAINEIDFSYTIAGSELKVLCGKSGSARLELKCTIGDTEVVRPLALISREQNASNGGWL